MLLAKSPAAEDQIVTRHVGQRLLQRAPGRRREDHVVEGASRNDGLDDAPRVERTAECAKDGVRHRIQRTSLESAQLAARLFTGALRSDKIGERAKARRSTGERLQRAFFHNRRSHQTLSRASGKALDSKGQGITVFGRKVPRSSADLDGGWCTRPVDRRFRRVPLGIGRGPGGRPVLGLHARRAGQSGQRRSGPRERPSSSSAAMDAASRRWRRRATSR